MRGRYPKVSQDELSLEQLVHRLGIRSSNDWYRLRLEDIHKQGGRGLLQQYGGLAQMAKAVDPSPIWLPWQFTSVPHNYWNDPRNRKDFMDWLGQKLEFKELEDWYKLQKKNITENGGNSLLIHRFGGSPLKLLQDVFPEHPWLPWKLENLPKNFWNSLDNQKLFFDWLGEQLGITVMEKWYSVGYHDICKYGGEQLMTRYQSSPGRALKEIYPQFPWKPWKFSHVPRNHWDDVENMGEFITWLGQKLHVKHLDDWYRVSLSHIKRLGPSTLFERHNIYDVLSMVYKDHHWSMEKFHVPKASQRILYLTLQEIFPNSDTFENYVHNELYFQSGQNIQLDVFLPIHNLAFEYQGEQHYKDVYALGPGLLSLNSVYNSGQWYSNERAQEKREACIKKDITLIEVPYWWDFEKESLIETIHNLRPDLVLMTESNPIPKQCPILGIEETHSLLMKGHNWNKCQDLSGWWMCEIPDGLRVYWSGQTFMSVDGDVMSLPVEFVKDLPKIPLDGFLGFKNGQSFDYHLSDSIDWSQLKYMVLDLPGSKDPFERRMTALKKMTFPSHVIAIRVELCHGMDYLQQRLDSILQEGGSGLLLFKPQSMYVPGKSPNVVKVDHFTEREVRIRHKNFFDRIGRALGFTQLEDWYKISLDKVRKFRGGSNLERVYGNSLIQALQSVYPYHPWVPWMFVKVSSGFWDNMANRSNLMSWLSSELRVKTLEDWYRISQEQMEKLAPTTAIQSIGGLANLLQSCYPEHSWDFEKLSERKGPIKSGQRMLFVLLQEILPDVVVLEDYVHPDLSFASSGRKMELDIFIPQYSLAFEYQGQQHYYDAYQLGPQWAYKQRDEEKREACKSKGITLIEIPYWWDQQKLSLQATIHKHRNDVVLDPGNGFPISEDPPEGFKDQRVNLPLMLAQNWNFEEDLSGWLLSEKMDGVRAYWDGQRLLSKQGNEIAVPDYFKKGLPKISVDGELWLGRNSFETFMSLLHSKNGDWGQVQYVLFDAPSNEPFETRLQVLKTLVLPGHIRVAEFEKCTGQNHLMQLLNMILKNGGEGLMAHKANSYYHPGRSPDLLKIKVHSTVHILTAQAI